MIRNFRRPGLAWQIKGKTQKFFTTCAELDKVPKFHYSEKWYVTRWRDRFGWSKKAAKGECSTWKPGENPTEISSGRPFDHKPLRYPSDKKKRRCLTKLKSISAPKMPSIAVAKGSFRGSTVFIADTRNCKSREQEIRRVNRELANIS